MNDANRIYIGALRGHGGALHSGDASYCVILRAGTSDLCFSDPALREVMADMSAADGEIICIVCLTAGEEHGHAQGATLWDACRLSDVAAAQRDVLLALAAPHGLP